MMAEKYQMKEGKSENLNFICDSFWSYQRLFGTKCNFCSFFATCKRLREPESANLFAFSIGLKPFWAMYILFRQSATGLKKKIKLFILIEIWTKS